MKNLNNNAINTIISKIKRDLNNLILFKDNKMSLKRRVRHIHKRKKNNNIINIDEYFNTVDNIYENKIKKIILNHSFFFKTIVDFIPSGEKQLFELGCGTGFITELVLKANPNLEITCIDKSPWMLEIIRNKTLLENVKLILGDVLDVNPDKKYDIILTTLNLHHFSDMERLKVIKMIYSTLNEGGIFINGDVFKPETEFEETIYRGMWYTSMIEAGFSEENAKCMIKIREDAYDSIDTFENYKKKLISAGFENICCPYTNNIYGIFVAYK